MSGVVIDVDTNASQADRELNKVTKSLAELVSQAKKSGNALDNMGSGKLKDVRYTAEKTSDAIGNIKKASTSSMQSVTTDAKKADDALAGIKSTVSGLIASFAALASVNAFNNAGDDLINFQNKLRQVTKTSEELFVTQRKLIKLSRETRSDLQGTASVYNKFAKSLENTGVGQDRIIGVVKTLQQAAASSGSSAESVNAAMIQLGQGLSAGVLRGEEWNSVTEQMGDVSRGLAKSLGKTTAEMRAFVNDGQLTTAVLIKGLEKMAKVTDESFGKSMVTAAVASGQLSSSIKLFFGEINQHLGTSQRFAKNMLSMASTVGGAADLVLNKMYTMKQSVLNFVTSLDLLGGEEFAKNVSLKLGLNSAQQKDKIELYKKAQKYLDGFRDFFGLKKTLAIETNIDFSFLPNFAKDFIDDKVLRKQRSGLQELLALSGTTAKVSKAFQVLRADFLSLSQLELGTVVEDIKDLTYAIGDMIKAIGNVTVTPMLDKFGPMFKDAAKSAQRALVSTLTFSNGRKIGDMFVNGVVFAFRQVGSIVERLFPVDASKSLGTNISKSLMTVSRSVLSFASGFFTQVGYRIKNGFPVDMFDVIVESAGQSLRKATTLMWEGAKGIASAVAQGVAGIDFASMFEFSDAALQQATDHITGMYREVLSETSALADKVVVKVREFGEAVKDIFFDCYDAVVGHSYWPDLIDGVIEHTDRLSISESRVKRFAESVKKMFLGAYEYMKQSGLNAGGAVREFTLKVTNVDVGDMMEVIKSNLAGAVTAGLMIAFGGLRMKLAGASFLLNMFNGAFDGAISLLVPTIGAVFIAASADIAASLGVSLINTVKVFAETAPVFIDNFLKAAFNTLVDGAGDMLSFLSGYLPYLSNELIGTLAGVAAAAAFFFSGTRGTIMDALFGEKQGKGEARKRVGGLLSFVSDAVLGVKVAADRAVEPGFLSKIFLDKGLALGGVAIALTGFSDAISGWSSAFVAIPMIVTAILGPDGGAAAMHLIINKVGIAFGYLWTSVMGLTPIKGIIASLFVGSGSDVVGPVRKSFGELTSTLSAMVTNFRRNSPLYKAGTMSLMDAFLQNEMEVGFAGLGVARQSRLQVKKVMGDFVDAVTDFKIGSKGSTVGTIFTSIGDAATGTLAKVKNVGGALVGVIGSMLSGMGSAIGSMVALFADAGRAIAAIFSSKTFLGVMLALALGFSGMAAASDSFGEGLLGTSSAIETIVVSIAALTAGLSALGIAYRVSGAFGDAKALHKGISAGTSSVGDLVGEAAKGLTKGTLKVSTDSLEAYEASLEKVQARIAEIAGSKTAFGAGASGLKFYLTDAFDAAAASMAGLFSKMKKGMLAMKSSKAVDMVGSSSAIAQVFATLIKGVKDTEKTGLSKVAERFTAAGEIASTAFSVQWASVGSTFADLSSSFMSLVGKMRLGLAQMLIDVAAWGAASWTANAPWLAIAAAVGAVVGIVGALGVMFFGEGNTFFEKLDYTYDTLKGIFGFASTTGTGRKSEIASLLADQTVGDREISFQSSIASVDFAKLNEAQYKVALDTANESKTALDNLNEIFIRQGKFTEENKAELERITKTQSDLNNRLPQRSTGDGVKGIEADFNEKIKAVNMSFWSRWDTLFGNSVVWGKMPVKEVEAMGGAFDKLSVYLAKLFDVIKNGGPVGIAKDVVFGAYEKAYDYVAPKIKDATTPKQTEISKSLQQVFKGVAGDLPTYSKGLSEENNAEFLKVYSRTADAMAEYSRLAGEGLNAEGVTADNHAEKLVAAAKEMAQAMNEMNFFRNKHGDDARNRFKTTEVIDRQKTSFDTIKAKLNIDFGTDNKDFRGTQGELIKLREFADQAAEETKKLNTLIWSDEARAASKAKIESLNQQAAAYANYLKQALSLNTDFQAKATASQGVFSTEDMQKLFVVDPAAYSELELLNQKFVDVSAQMAALPKTAKPEDWQHLQDQLRSVRDEIIGIVKLTPSLDSIASHISAAGGEDLSISAKLAVGTDTLMRLDSAAQNVMQLERNLKDLYTTGTPDQQLAALKALNEAALKFKNDIATAQLAPAQQAANDESMGPAQKAQTIARSLGKEIPENILTNSNAMLKWANIQLVMLATQVALNKEIGKGAEGSDKIITDLGVSLHALGKEATVLTDTTVYTFDSLLGGLGEAGIAINGLSFSRLGDSAKSALSGIGTRLEALQKRLANVSAGTAVGSISAIMEEKVALLAEARNYMAEALHNTGAGITEGLSRIGISEMKDVARMSAAGLKELLDMDAQITMAKLTQNDTQSQEEYLKKAKEIAALERKKARLVEESNKSFSTQLDVINEIFGTSLKGLDVVGIDPQMFAGLADQAIKLKYDIQDAIEAGATAGSSKLQGLFARMADVQRTGTYLTFFSEMQKGVESAFTDGARTSFEKLSSMMGDMAVDFDTYLSLPDEMRKTFTAQSAVLEAYDKALDLPDLSKELANILNQASKPIDEIMAEFQARFAAENGASAADELFATQGDKSLGFLERIANATERGAGVKAIKDGVTTAVKGTPGGSIGRTAAARTGAERFTKSQEIANAAAASAVNTKDLLKARLSGASTKWDKSTLDAATEKQMKAAIGVSEKLAEKLRALTDAELKKMPTDQLQRDVILYQEALGSIADAIETNAARLAEAGKSFASEVGSSLNTGISDLLQGKAEEGETAIETFANAMADSMQSAITDAFVKGMMDPLTGEGGVLTTLMEGMGKDLYSLGGLLTGNESSKVGEDGTTDAAKAVIEASAKDEGMFADLGKTFMEGFSSVSDVFSQGLKGLSGMFSGGGMGDMLGGLGEINWTGMATSAMGFLGFASGGEVSGRGTNTSDSIPTMLSNGEFVVNARSTRKNLTLLRALNSGQSFSRYAAGGLVSPTSVLTRPSSTTPTTAQNSRGRTEQVFNLHITGDVSRQTRSEILRMLPQIAVGVNTHNTETGRR